MSKKVELEKWLVGRPQIVKDIARKYPPWEDYIHKDRPDTATYNSISEDGTITCNKIDFFWYEPKRFNPDTTTRAADAPSNITERGNE